MILIPNPILRKSKHGLQTIILTAAVMRNNTALVGGEHDIKTQQVLMLPVSETN
jgi:hypothetical protein